MIISMIIHPHCVSCFLWVFGFYLFSTEKILLSFSYTWIMGYLIYKWEINMHLNVLAFKVYKILLLYTLVSVFKEERVWWPSFVSEFLFIFFLHGSEHTPLSSKCVYLAWCEVNMLKRYIQNHKRAAILCGLV